MKFARNSFPPPSQFTADMLSQHAVAFGQPSVAVGSLLNRLRELEKAGQTARNGNYWHFTGRLVAPGDLVDDEDDASDPYGNVHPDGYGST